MPINLSKGQKVDLTKGNASLKHIMVGLGWDVNAFDSGSDFDLDAAAFMLGADGKCPTDKEFVFYGNLEHPSGAVKHQGDNLTGEGDGDDEQIFVDLKAIPESVDKIAFTVTIYEAQERRQNFGQVSNAYIRIVDEDTNQKTEVGKTGDDKCFFAGCDGFFLGIIETDEQVRADAHQFPKDVHLENIGCYYQSQH